MFKVRTVIPGKLAVAAQPVSADLSVLAEHGFKTLISNRPDNEAENQPTADEIRAAAAKHGLSYIHIPVTLGTLSRRDIDAFREALEKSPGPAVAHCGSGKRAFLLWAAGEVLYGNRSVHELVDQAAGIDFDAKELHQIIQHSTESSEE